jgi:CHAT domain-containing protein
MAGGRQASGLLTPEQRQRERELTQAVLSASAEIDALMARRTYDQSQLTELEGKLSRARLERDAYTTELYKSAPDLRIARGDAPVITRDDLNALVKPATAIISLVRDNRTVWAYVMTRRSGAVEVATRQVPMTTDQLDALADQFARQVATRDLGFAANARKLYDLLFVATQIEPMLNGKSRVVFVPDGPLWRVPFQALQTPRDTFLIEERAIAYAPSVSALASLERRRQSRAAREPYLLALGDPAIPAGAERRAFAGRRVFGRLPQAAREVAALGQLYGDAQSRVLVGEHATEVALRDNLGRATVVHVATHGVLDDISPLYSHLMLAPATGKSSDTDGRLEAWELMDQPLNVDLRCCRRAKPRAGRWVTVRA